MAQRPKRAVVSGSFHCAMPQVQAAVYELHDLGVLVLSPSDPKVTDQFGDFLFVASDRMRSIRLVQQRHLAAIAAADLLWLVAADGYVGLSASMEIGYAAAVGTPVFAATPPNDLTLRQWVHVVRDPRAALTVLDRAVVGDVDHVLLDPASVIEDAHAHLDRILRSLVVPVDAAEAVVGDSARWIRRVLDGV